MSDEELIAIYMGDVGLTRLQNDKIVPYTPSYKIWQTLMPVVEKINTEHHYDAIHIDKDDVFLHVYQVEMFRYTTQEYPKLIDRIFAAVVQYMKIKRST